MSSGRTFVGKLAGILILLQEKPENLALTPCPDRAGIELANINPNSLFCHDLAKLLS